MHEQSQVQGRMSLAQFPDDEAGKRDQQDHGDSLEKWGIQPVKVVAHIQQRLQTQEQDGEQEKAYDIETRVSPVKPAPV